MKEYLNKAVLIKKKETGALYGGVLNGIRGNRIHLTNLVILDKEGRYKAQSKTDTGRWFNVNTIDVIKGE